MVEEQLTEQLPLLARSRPHGLLGYRRQLLSSCCQAHNLRWVYPWRPPFEIEPLRASTPTTGTFHDPRDVGGRLHNLARHYHPCRNRKWTDRCGRDVCLEQLAGHDRTFSLHNGSHQLADFFFLSTTSRRLWVSE